MVHFRKCHLNKLPWVFIAIMVLLTSSQLFADTYQVGPGRTYTDLQSVADLLQPGDVVEVDGDNTYTGGVSFYNPGDPDDPITIRGIRINGRRPIISGGTDSVAFRTPWPYSDEGADHYVFEGFEVTGGASRGIYHQADDLTIRDVVVHGCPSHGILGADQGSGSLTMAYVEVYGCGDGDQRHQIYMATDEVNSPGSIFRMEFCYIHDGTGGNNVKSRAERNEIYYNWIENAYYHELELIGPDGGDGDDPSLKREDSDVVGNVLRKTSRNGFVTRVGGDGTGETNGRYRFVNNTIICDQRAVFRIFHGIESIEMHNNIFYRNDGGEVDLVRSVEAEWSSGSELIAGSNNWVPNDAINIPSQWTGTVLGTTPDFENLAQADLRPVEDGNLTNGANPNPASVPGYPFPNPLTSPAWHPPMNQADDVDGASARPSDGQLDMGAYEAGTGSPTSPPDDPAPSEGSNSSSSGGCFLAASWK